MSVDSALVGTWENTTRGDRIALLLSLDGSCEITLERALRPAKKRSCKFELFHSRYALFIVKDNGQCGDEADFEFSFDRDAPLVHFYIGAQTLVMNKLQ